MSLNRSICPFCHLLYPSILLLSSDSATPTAHQVLDSFCQMTNIRPSSSASFLDHPYSSLRPHHPTLFFLSCVYYVPSVPRPSCPLFLSSVFSLSFSISYSCVTFSYVLPFFLLSISVYFSVALHFALFSRLLFMQLLILFFFF